MKSDDIMGLVKKIAEESGMVEVVRCKDCENWDEQFHFCNIRDSYGWDYKPDDFCSYGKRGEENGN